MPPLFAKLLLKSSCYKILSFVSLAFILTLLCSCDNEIDDNRIPALNVQINLSNPGLWNVYGVHGYGDNISFIREERQPAGFAFTETTYTGFGGVLLIMGMDPFEAGAVAPLAYDLSCPVECKAYVRVYVDPSNYDAVCPVCGSHYDVTMGGGAPVSGPALTGQVKYGLQRYRAVPRNGGYMITR